MDEKGTIYVGTKFHNHDSAIFVVNPAEKKIFALSTERKTRYKHDFLMPLEVLDAYIQQLAQEHKNPDEITCIRVSYPFNTGKLSIVPDTYSFHTNFRKHYQVQFKKDVDVAYNRFLRLGWFKQTLALLTSIHGLHVLFSLIRHKISEPKRVPLAKAIPKLFHSHFPHATVVVTFYDHETCHAISSHYTSPYEKELLFASDGWGDQCFSKVFTANKGQVRQIAESRIVEANVGSAKKPRIVVGSVGKVYSYFTTLLGFIEDAEEGKVEALAAYGTSIPHLLEELVSLFSINKNDGLTADSKKMAAVLNYDRMQTLLQQKNHEDIAATVQKFLETVTRNYLRHLITKYPFDAIALSGGVAANVINNKMIFEHICDKVHVVPAMGDDGSAQGAALMAMLEQGYTYESLGWMREQTLPYYGTSYTKTEVQDTLERYKTKLSYTDSGVAWPEKVAALINKGAIGAIFHGRMEWGPRALGNRSILASPTRPNFRDRINKEIKRRPYFQPFCPSILEEERERLFVTSYANKHMTCAFQMKKEFWKKLPGAIHIDGTSRVQFVEKNDNEPYYRILKKLQELSGFGVLINTSFNKHGRTIVESPEDALQDFIDTDMDFLMIEGFLLLRSKGI